MMMMPMIMMSKGGRAGVSHYLGHGRPRLGRQCQYSHVHNRAQSGSTLINKEQPSEYWNISYTARFSPQGPPFTTRTVWVSLRCGSQGGFEPLLRTRPKGGDLNFQYLCLTHMNTNTRRHAWLLSFSKYAKNLGFQILHHIYNPLFCRSSSIPKWHWAIMYYSEWSSRGKRSA